MGRSLEQYEREKAYTGRWGIPGVYITLGMSYVFRFASAVIVAIDIWQRWAQPAAEKYGALWPELAVLALFWLVGWVMEKCARYTLALDQARKAKQIIPPPSSGQP